MTDSIRTASEDLERLARNLDNKQIMKALRTALRREARTVKRAAAQRLRNATISGKRLSHGAKIAQTIHSGATRKLDGYYVSVRNRGEKSMHKNRAGKEKPIAFWLNHGVSDRHTKAGRGLSGKGKTPGKRGGRRTGSIAGLDFISETERAEVLQSAARLAAEYEKAVRKIADKTFRR